MVSGSGHEGVQLVVVDMMWVWLVIVGRAGEMDSM